MKLQVEQVKEQIGKEFPFGDTISTGQLEDVEAYPWSHHDINVKGTYWYDGLNIRVVGEIYRQGEYECARCLRSVEYSDSLFLDETFTNLPEEDCEEFLHYEGDELDLTALIRETLIVNEPYQVLCSEHCKGLCKHCGINLNEEQCACDSEEGDPRLAVLRELLKNNS